MMSAQEIAARCRSNIGFRHGYYLWIWVKASEYGFPTRVCSGCQSWAQLRRYRRALRRRDTALARGPVRPSPREARPRRGGDS